MMVKRTFFHVVLVFALLFPAAGVMYAQDRDSQGEAGPENVILLPYVQAGGLAAPEADVRAEQVSGRSTDFVPGEVLVGFHRAEVLAATLLAETGVYAVEALDLRGLDGGSGDGGIQGQILHVPVGSEWDVIDRLTNNPAVAFATPNWLVHAAGSVAPTQGGTATLPNSAEATSETPYLVNDPLYEQEQWYMQRINASRAWSLILRENGSPVNMAPVRVAIIDSGINFDHPEFTNRILDGKNYVAPTQPPIDDFGHGTHVAGLIGATVNNGVGITGAAPWVQIDPRKVLNNFGSGSITSVANAIRDAADDGAKIINMSLETGTPNAIMHSAIQYAENEGALLVAVTGNLNQSTVQWPGAYPEVMAVAATNYSDRRASYSSRGAEVEIAAPGGDTSASANYTILSTWGDSTVPCRTGRVGGDYCRRTGTSMAAALVSGVAAMIWGIRPDFTASQVRVTLNASAAPLAESATAVGNGRLDAHAAVRLAFKGDLQLSQLSSSRNLAPRAEPYQVAVTLENPSANPITWQVNLPTATTWLTTTTGVSGTIRYGEPATVSLVISPTNLPQGVYSRTVTFVGTRADNSTVARTFDINILISENIRQWFIPYLNSGVSSSGAPPTQPGGLVPFSWETPGVITPTVYAMTDEAMSQETIPFTLTLKGRSFTDMSIYSNGFVRFPKEEFIEGSDNNRCIPNAPWPAQAVYGWWADLNPGQTSSTVSSFQPAANRFVIEFNKVPTSVNADSSYTVSFQIVLYQDGRVGLNYRDVVGLSNAVAHATIGVETSDGRFHNQIVCRTDSEQYGFLPRAGQSFLFIPEDVY